VSDLPEDWILPDWPAPRNVRACVTTRCGGVSLAPYDSFNLGDHVGDQPHAVASNRQHLQRILGCDPAWMNQVHSSVAVEADAREQLIADGCWTATPGVACAVLTADCLPVLFCNLEGSRVAAAHAGWRGLSAGMLEATIESMQTPGADLMAWLGPAIGPAAFEVGAEVREAFVARNAEAAAAFLPSRNSGRFMADLYHLARIRLAGGGVSAVYGGGFCTVSDTRFYSYRRAAQTGRFASLIWLEQAAQA
jgi:polyphenol oxidase